MNVGDIVYFKGCTKKIYCKDCEYCINKPILNNGAAKGVVVEVGDDHCYITHNDSDGLHIYLDALLNKPSYVEALLNFK